MAAGLVNRLLASICLLIALGVVWSNFSTFVEGNEMRFGTFMFGSGRCTVGEMLLDLIGDTSDVLTEGLPRVKLLPKGLAF